MATPAAQGLRLDMHGFSLCRTAMVPCVAADLCSGHGIWQRNMFVDGKFYQADLMKQRRYFCILRVGVHDTHLDAKLTLTNRTLTHLWTKAVYSSET